MPQVPTKEVERMEAEFSLNKANKALENIGKYHVFRQL